MSNDPTEARPGSDRSNAQADAHQETSVWDLMNPVLRHRRLVVFIPVVVTLVVAVSLLTSTRMWTSTASFLPASQSAGRGGTSALAQQLGIDVSAAGDPGQTPEFYRVLLRSKELARAIVDRQYSYLTESGVTSASLIDLFGTTPDDPLPRRRESAMRQLLRSTDVSIDERTGQVTVAVHTQWPEVSQQIAAQMIDLVNQFNMRRIRQQASARREFMAQMVDSARRELRGAEDQLQFFIQRNRVWANDPQLVLEHDRLARDVQMRQSVYTALTSTYAQARIEAIRDTPLITVVESPVVPIFPDARGTVRKSFAALVFGSLVAMLLAFGIEFFKRSRQTASDDYAQFLALRDDAVADARRILRPVTKVLRSQKRNGRDSSGQ